MNKTSQGVIFSVPYEIAVVRPLRQTTLSERSGGPARGSFQYRNLFRRIGSTSICARTAVSVRVSTPSTGCFGRSEIVEPGMGLAAEARPILRAPGGANSKYFGFSTSSSSPLKAGRPNESGARFTSRPNTVVAGNMLFPSTRVHIEMNGAKVIDVIGGSRLRSDIGGAVQVAISISISGRRR